MTRRGAKAGAVYLGIEIGGTKLQLCVGDSSAKILERFNFSVNPKAGAGGIRSQLQKTIPDLAKRFKPAGVGIGFGGPVDWRTGRICCSHQIEGWSEFPLALWVSELAGVPVRIDNDANVGALGEAMLGTGRGHAVVFYVTLGSGVGGGLVTNGAIYHGAVPGESEIGHVRLDKSGAIVEDRCSGWAVDRRLRSAARKHPKSALAKCIGNATAHEAKFLPAALKAKDPFALEILNETADDLAFGLSHVTHLFHPHIIVLGGGLVFVGEPLRRSVEKALRRYTMEVFAPGPKIALASLREDAVPTGALSLASAPPAKDQ